MEWKLTEVYSHIRFLLTSSKSSWRERDSGNFEPSLIQPLSIHIWLKHLLVCGPANLVQNFWNSAVEFWINDYFIHYANYKYLWLQNTVMISKIILKNQTESITIILHGRIPTIWFFYILRKQCSKISVNQGELSKCVCGPWAFYQIRFSWIPYLFRGKIQNLLWR